MTPHRSPTTSNTSRATALLALAAATKPPSTPCLGDEQLALLLDGRGGHEQKDLLSHLALCPDCYQRWLLASDNRAALRGRLRRLRPIGLALAAAACLVLYLQVVELDKTPIAPLPAAPQAILPEKTSADKAESSSLPARAKFMPLQDKKEIPEVVASTTTTPAIPLPAPAPRAVGDASPPPAERLKSTAAAPPAPIATLPGPRQLLSLEKENKATAAPPQQEVRPATPSAMPSSAPVGASREAAPAPPDAELEQWRRDLAGACRRHEDDPHTWRLLSERGQRLQHSHGTVDTALLALIQEIEGADSVTPACRRILDELAKNGMDK
jgi:hypothetical protein